MGCNSSFFYELFFGENPKNEFHDTDFDSTSFRLFLDCLMGFKPYTDLDSLLIFPIAHKYKTEESLKRCIQALKPKVMNETVCHTLNLALYYNCQELVDAVICFLNEKFDIFSLLENEELYSVLEPITLAKLIENIKLNSSLVISIFKWAGKYIKNKKKSASVVSFLKEHNIFEKGQKVNFESFEAIFDFLETEEIKDLFAVRKFYSLIKNKIAIDDPRRFPDSSKWVTVKKGEQLIEHFKFKDYVRSYLFNDAEVTLQVWRNEMIFMGKDDASYVSCKMYTLNNSFPLWMVRTFPICYEKDGKYIYVIKIPTPCIPEKILYTFNVDCRILKTSFDRNLLSEDKTDQYYFTYCIKKIRVPPGA